VATDQFVIDGISPPYTFSQESPNGRLGRIFNNVLHAFHPLLNPPKTMLRKEEWQHDWQNDELVETMLLESDTDVACVQSPPIFDAYHDGLISVEKGANLKRHTTGSPG
jgi:uncharacterized protein